MGGARRDWCPHPLTVAVATGPACRPQAAPAKPYGAPDAEWGVVQWWRDFFSRELARVRRDGRASMLWSMRITVAATAGYVVASLFFPGTQPLLAPLTAMLVVQVTPLSLLASGLDRVIAVVAGVALAVAFAAVVPLEWWSLGVLILISITVGEFLRLRSNLVEVAISAMLVLGVGAIGAEAAAWQRIAETLVGAAVGIIATLVFPPKVPSSDAGRAIDGLGEAVSELLNRAAGELDAMAEGDPHRLSGSARAWLGDARLITHNIPVVGAALLRAEEGRRLNVRAVRTPYVEAGLRQGLEALEHTAVAIRGLMRSVTDASDGDWLDEHSASDVLRDLAETFRQLAEGADSFGGLVRHEGDVQDTLSRDDIAHLQEAQDGMLRARARLDAALTEARSPDVVELYAAARATVRRLQHELGLDERVRGQLRHPPRGRPHLRPGARRRSAGEVPDTTGSEDETQVLPRLSDEHPEDGP
ncbi:MAG: hypothetical protein QOF35_2173 [Actinomycetota bacterium]|nr:hypothetical protein [Actinomycetota bacterium]